jgi:phosphohistidine phosphatase
VAALARNGNGCDDHDVNARVEVQLHLLRHAHAGDPMKWHGSDDVRPLSEKGRLQAERLGRFLAEAGFAPDAIVSSPKARALETARLVATSLGLPVRVDDALAGPFDIGTLEALLDSAGDPRRPLLVGHDPDFGQLAADLTGLAELPLRKGALVRIDLVRPIEAGAGLLRWLLPADLLAVPD